jgi:hypothetical protein
MMKKRGFSRGGSGGRRKPATRTGAGAGTSLRGVRGLAWYTPEQWPRLMEVSADGASLGKDHASWLAQAEQDFKGLKAIGVTIRKILVDVEDLAAWCRRNRRPVDADSRTAYIAEQLRSGRADFVP